jgi:hypothetical protein
MSTAPKVEIGKIKISASPDGRQARADILYGYECEFGSEELAEERRIYDKMLALLLPLWIVVPNRVG